MIEKFEIKKINNEEIFVIYLNYNYEFGKISSNNKPLKENIKEILTKERKFKGNKLLLFVSGILIATIMITREPITNDIIDLTYVNSAIIRNEIKPEKISNEKKEEIEVEVSNKKEPKENNNKKELKENNNKKEKVKIEKKQIEKNKVNDIVDKTITIYRSNGEVTLSMTDYLIGVVGAEMPASFNIEALKAQAVVARTYALKTIQEGKKLTDTTETQVYKDNKQLKKMWGNEYEKYYSKIKNAVTSTNEICVYYQGKYIDAVYHSTSNGYTENAKEVWKNDIPYLKSVESFDINTTSYLKTITKEEKTVLNILGIEDFNEIEILERNSSNRVSKIKVGDKIYTGPNFRSILGLRSTDFEIKKEEDNIIFTTKGYGHGVGMSQYGAQEMTKKGYNYKDILKHYYQGVEIV